MKKKHHNGSKKGKQFKTVGREITEKTWSEIPFSTKTAARGAKLGREKHTMIIGVHLFAKVKGDQGVDGASIKRHDCRATAKDVMEVPGKF